MANKKNGGSKAGRSPAHLLSGPTVESVHDSVFLTFAREDAALGRALVAELYELGITARIDEAEVRYDDSWVDSISSVVEKVKTVVLLISPSFLGSSWLNIAAGVAVGEEARSSASRVVPVLLPGVERSEVPALLRPSRAIDATGLVPHTLAQRIATAVRGEQHVQPGSTTAGLRRVRSGAASKKLGS
jgi:hypothetical protein